MPCRLRSLAEVRSYKLATQSINMVVVLREPEAPHYSNIVQGRLVGQPMLLVYDIMVLKELSFILGEEERR